MERRLRIAGGVLALVLLSAPALARAADAAAADWRLLLTRGGQLPTHERLLVVDADGRVLESIDGDASRVLLPDALFTRLCDERLRATLVHNHPDSLSLSGSDLIQLAKAGVERVIAVGHDGTTYNASAGRLFGDGSGLARDYSAVADHVLAAIVTEGRRGTLDAEAFAPQVTHLVALVLARLHVITYEVRPSLAFHLLLDRHRATIDRIVDTEVRRLKAAWSVPASVGLTASR